MDMQGLLAAREGQSGPSPRPGRQAAVCSGMELVRRRHARRPWWSGFPPYQVMFKNEQGWLGTQGPRGGLSLCPGPWPRRGRGASCPPSPSALLGVSAILITILKRWRGPRRWPWGGSHATIEPIGLRPSAPGAPQCPPARQGCPDVVSTHLDPWEGADPVSSPPRWFCHPGQAWGVEGGRRLAPSSTMTQ